MAAKGATALKTKADDTEKKAGTDLTTKANTALDPSLAQAYGSGPTGFEHDRADDFVIPFFTILQGLSPQMETVPGAKLGNIINTSSNEMFEREKGINLVVVGKRYNYVEWKPNRGGLVAVHEVDSDVVKKALAAVGGDKFAKLNVGDNDLIEVKYVLGVMCDENKNPLGFGTIGFASTKIKKYNAWNTDARNKLGQFGLPLHALAWNFGVTKERNTKGEFFNWTHTMLGGNVKTAIVDPVENKPLFDAVKELRDRAGTVKIDHASERAAEQDEDAM